MLVRLLAAALAALALPASALTFPGENGPFAYVSDRDGDVEIWSQQLDGTGLANLTRSPGVDQSPAWSADGRRVAFTSFRDGGRQAIYVMNADGSDQHRVSPEDSLSDDATPAWSPDGSRLVFASTRPFGTRWAIWSMNADGTDLRQISPSSGTDPAWSPDGSLIAYAGPGEAINVMNADGSNGWRITNGGGFFESAPAWSPDGRWLVFARYTGGGVQELVIGSPFDFREQSITSGAFDANPVWSPDQRWILFQRHQGTASHTRRLYIMSTSTLEAFPYDDLPGASGEPDWSVRAAEEPPPPPPDPAPVITVLDPREDGSYVLGSSWTVAFKCRDGDAPEPTCDATLDGVAISSGDPLPTSQPGAHRFDVTSRDLGGNETTVTRWYWVVYDATGVFAAPLAPFPQFSEHRAGSDLPVRFTLSGDQGLDVFAREPVSREVACDAPEFGQWGDPTSGKLHYNATLDRYTYVWETDKAWAGTCRQFVMKLDDTSYWYAYVRFTK